MEPTVSLIRQVLGLVASELSEIYSIYSIVKNSSTKSLIFKLAVDPAYQVVGNQY